MQRKSSNPTTETGTPTITRVAAGSAETAISRNVAALAERNDHLLRQRVESRASAGKQAASFYDALEAALKGQTTVALPDLRRESLVVDLDGCLAQLERSSRGSSLLMLPLSKHINMYGPPYDYGWSWGNPDAQVSDPQTGRCAVAANSVHAGAAAAGIGLLLTSDKPALVFVRAYVPASWRWIAKTIGIGSSASVRGGWDASAWVDGALCTLVRRDDAFQGSARGFDGEKRGEGDGVAYGENISLNFMMSPGKTYAVNYGVWIECEDDPAVGVAGAGGGMDATVQFVVVERFVAG